VINADASIEDLQKQLQNIIKTVMEDSKHKPISKLWTDGYYTWSTQQPFVTMSQNISWAGKDLSLYPPRFVF